MDSRFELIAGTTEGGKMKLKLSEASEKANESPPTKVIITDIEIPFMSMVMFMVEWALAAIPAIIILSLAIWLPLWLLRG